MEIYKLKAVSPLDGRYANQVNELSRVFSESALIDYRLKAEASWLLFLGETPKIPLPKISKKTNLFFQTVLDRSDQKIAEEVKAIEKKTNHDVKAVEYAIRERIIKSDPDLISWIHFACTSEDINNVAYAMMMNDFRDQYLMPQLKKIMEILAENAFNSKNISMLSRTHGQPASPTTLGKEWAVFGYRILNNYELLSQHNFSAKWNGATGNFHAHVHSLPDIDWFTLSQKFIESLGFNYNPLTTQIENHDNLVRFISIWGELSKVLEGLCKDMWGYISLGYFSLKVNRDEVGSSTMPHKVNPIDFENAEGNFGLSSAMAHFFSDKLLQSRWQRDLSDSTLLRSLGSMFAYGYLALKSLEKGLNKISPTKEKIAEDLEDAWETLTEAIQTKLRVNGVHDAYERLKKFSRGKKITKNLLHDFIDTQKELTSLEKKHFKKLQPQNYTGLSSVLVDKFLEQWRVYKK